MKRETHELVLWIELDDPIDELEARAVQLPETSVTAAKISLPVLIRSIPVEHDVYADDELGLKLVVPHEEGARPDDTSAAMILFGFTEGNVSRSPRSVCRSSEAWRGRGNPSPPPTRIAYALCLRFDRCSRERSWTFKVAEGGVQKGSIERRMAEGDIYRMRHHTRRRCVPLRLP